MLARTVGPGEGWIVTSHVRGWIVTSHVRGWIVTSRQGVDCDIPHHGVDLVGVPYRLEKETSASEDGEPWRGGGL